MELHVCQIVRSVNNVRHSSEYLSNRRVYLLHIVNPETGRCFCGRDPEGWDMPYREYRAGSRERDATVSLDELSDSDLCQPCKRGFLTAGQ